MNLPGVVNLTLLLYMKHTLSDSNRFLIINNLYRCPSLSKIYQHLITDRHSGFVPWAQKRESKLIMDLVWPDSDHVSWCVFA